MFLGSKECILLVLKRDKSTILNTIDKPNRMLKMGRSFFFYVHECVNISSIENENVRSDMMWKDYKFEFEEGKYGSIFRLSSQRDKFRVTWSTILKGRSDSVQLWYKSTHFRNVFPAFKNKRRTASGLLNLQNYLFEEMFLDRVQFAHVQNSFYHSILIESNKDLIEKEQTVKSSTLVISRSNDFSVLLKEIDDAFC